MKSGKTAFSSQFNMGTICLLTQKFAPPSQGGDKSVNKYIITFFYCANFSIGVSRNIRTRGHKLDFFCIRKLICVTDWLIRD